MLDARRRTRYNTRVRRASAIVLLVVLALTAVPGWTAGDDCDEEGAGCCVPMCHSCFCCAVGGSAILVAGAAPAPLAPMAQVPLTTFPARLDVLPRPILHVPRSSLLA